MYAYRYLENFTLNTKDVAISNNNIETYTFLRRGVTFI